MISQGKNIYILVISNSFFYEIYFHENFNKLIYFYQISFDENFITIVFFFVTTYLIVMDKFFFPIILYM